ncbi:MAG TPA: DNA primase catalytic subunit PriS [Thermoplasmata archaeon]|jgi:DNA primase small subunit|nr:DNA primase catalytic subunit PriS [Thermoplasmata archaeon]
MAAPDAAREATSNFLKAEFQRYYERTRPALPDRFRKREFGFMFWTAGIVQRHLGFAREEDLHSFLKNRVPAHAYYSSAYYETPDAPTMEEKGWLGADLIFDLDADHLPNAAKLSYPEMLEAVRLKILHLYDDFLREDFGFEEKAMRIVFSGGRGYHIHVFDERVWSLGSHERREIVDWITGKGLDVGAVFRESAFDKKEFQGHTRIKRRVIAPAQDEPGWRGKIMRGIQGLTTTLESLTPEEAIKFLTSFEGVREGEAADLYENLFKARATRPRVIRGVDRLREGQIEALSDPSRDLLIRIVKDLQPVRLAEHGGVSLDGIIQRGETDEPVTSDIKRLIRMPSSLHGKTGLRVLPLTRDALETFRPLRDAVPETWNDERVRMKVKGKVDMEMRGDEVHLEPGVQDVPEYVAVFLAARGLGNVAPADT